MKTIKCRIKGASAVMLLASTLAMTGCGSKDESTALYKALQNNLMLTDSLRQGDVSYSFFGGDMQVANPHIAVSGSARSGNMQKVMQKAMLDRQTNEAGLEIMPGTRKYLRPLNQTTALNLKADLLTLSVKGSNENGSIRINLAGVQMDRPHLAERSGEVVPFWDVADQLQPNDTLASNTYRQGRGHFTNGVNSVPGIGNWFVNATGAFGATADIEMHLERNSSGKGSVKMVVTHKVDKSKVGSITREAALAEMQNLDVLINGASDLLLGMAITATDNNDVLGAVYVSNSATELARRLHVSEYSVTYDGYKNLKDVYKEAGYPTNEAGMKRFCHDTGINTNNVLKAGQGIEDDSECSIANSLIANGEYREQFKFDESKSLLSEMVVTRRYTAKVN